MPLIFNKNLLKKHRDYAAHNLQKSSFLIDYAAEDIASTLKLLDKEFCSILEIGSRSGALSVLLHDLYPEASFVCTETATEMIKSNIFSQSVINVDDEDIQFNGGVFDLVTSCMNFHWINDVSVFIDKISKILNKNGYFVLNFIGSGSLKNLQKYLLQEELKNSSGYTPHVIPFIQEDKVYRLFQQNGFDFIVVSSDKIELEYKNPMTLMRDLKNMGENNTIIASGKPLPRSVVEYSSDQPFCDIVNLITVVARHNCI